MSTRFFRKLGRQIAPAFRKLPGSFNTLGRQISNTSKDIGKGLEIAQKAIDTVDKIAPNPLLKIASGGLSGVRDLNRGAGIGGQAIRAVSTGNVVNAGNLALDALGAGVQGAGKVATTGVMLM